MEKIKTFATVMIKEDGAAYEGPQIRASSWLEAAKLAIEQNSFVMATLD